MSRIRRYADAKYSLPAEAAEGARNDAVAWNWESIEGFTPLGLPAPQWRHLKLRIRWEGCLADADTFEPIEQFFEDAPEAVRAFARKHPRVPALQEAVKAIGGRRGRPKFVDGVAGDYESEAGEVSKYTLPSDAEISRRIADGGAAAEETSRPAAMLQDAAEKTDARGVSVPVPAVLADAGWEVFERSGRNGRKDKYYFSPDGRRFRSLKRAKLHHDGNTAAAARKERIF